MALSTTEWLEELWTDDAGEREGSAATDLVGRPARVPPSVCLYTPSADPSGMGQHLLDLAEGYRALGGSVTVMAWPTEPGRGLLRRAAELGARPVPLPHPRDPAFGTAIRDDLRRHPVDVFHVHVGTGRENFDGARAARRAGVPAVVQTLHLPWLLASRRKREPFFAA